MGSLMQEGLDIQKAVKMFYLESTSMAFTLESYSAGSFSRMRYESLLTPTRSPGFMSSGSTRPITGRK